MKTRKQGFFRRAVGTAAATIAGWMGAYNSTDLRRKLLEFLKVQRATSDQTLAYNLPTLVAQCRHLERNCPSARAVVEGLAADIIGTGIDVAPETGSEPRDDKIRKEWLAWAEHAGVDGTSLWELQAQSVRELGAAGSMLWRYLVLPERVAEGKLPLAILPLEVEWLSALPVGDLEPGAVFVSGVERDRVGRPIAYHLIDPNLLLNQSAGIGARGERVLAKYISHGFEKRRPFQTLGEPILAPLVERLNQEEDLVKIELQAARIASNFAVAITSEDHDDATDDADGTGTGASVTDISPGTVTRLLPGEKAELLQSSRPNQQISPFRDMLRGDIAAAGRVSRKWLDRNYSNATFMNTRMEQADSKRQHKPTQNWLARHVATRPYLEVLPWILLKLGMAMPADPAARAAIEGHRLLPDLPEYVDPLKDGAAAIQNVAGGLSTLQEECASRGRDYQKIIDQHARETAESDAAVVRRIAALQTEIDAARAANPELSLDWSQVITLAGATSAPGAYLDAIASAQMAKSREASSGAQQQQQPADKGNE